MEADHIRIRGARVHNLKGIDLDLPLRQLICFAGPSGSGKTSLAFHTLHSESKRRFINSFPNSMKFFADRPSPVDVDEIYPVLPVFGLPQINPVLGSRSVVADIMRATEVMQGLWYSYSRECCPTHRIPVEKVNFAAQLGEASKKLKGEVFHLLVGAELGGALFGPSFVPPRSWDSKRNNIQPMQEGDDHWEVIRFKESSLAGIEEKQREIIPLLEGRPLLLWSEGTKKPIPFKYVSSRRCPKCDYAGKNFVRAGAFGPHTALGACKDCNGYGANLVYDPAKMVDRELTFDEGGVAFLRFGPLDWWLKELKKVVKRHKWPTDEPLKKLPKEFFKILETGEGSWPGFGDAKTYLDGKRYKPAVRVFMRKMQTEILCEACQGSRLDREVDNFLLPMGGQQLALKEIAPLTVEAFSKVITGTLATSEPHANRLQEDLRRKAVLACAMGLGHLSMSRKTRSLSAGEYQRLLLLKYLSFQGTDALFVLDEPSLGLGSEEQKMLLEGLREIIAQGNTVVVIDHSEQMQKASDYLIVMGPEAGHRGGEVLYAGETSKYKFQIQEKFTPPVVTTAESMQLKVTGPEVHGKKWSDFSVPLRRLVWAHGSSGTGKTAMLINVLAHHLYKNIHRENFSDTPGSFKSLSGAKNVSDVLVVDSNLNRFTSRSSVGSLTDIAPAVRRHFLKLPVAKSMGLKDGHLSRNSELGMCPRCEGSGKLVIEMQYLEDIVLPCEDCKGLGMKQVYAQISDGTMTVAEAFQKPLGEVLARIDLTPKFRRTWEYLKILNLDYLSLDRPLNSLSGGERQRVYLLSRLLKNMEDVLIIFENLSFGLSPREIMKLGQFLQDLAARGNSIVIIDNEPLWSDLAQAEMLFTPSMVTTTLKS